MARRGPINKPTPDSSKITRGPVTAFARRQRTNGDDAGDDEPDAPKPTTETKPEAPPPDVPTPDGEPVAVKPAAEAESARAPARTRAETMTMPPHLTVGTPPELPVTVAAPPPSLGAVEDPTYMPTPRAIPGGEPSDPAAPPGRVPPGDSRSLRNGNQFALVYRRATFIISRFGTVGTRGQWRVVEYPTSSSASHAYAKECSRFVSEGFADYRE